MTQKRSIFEDVSDNQPSGSSVEPRKTKASSRGGIALWLSVIFALLVVMLVVGAVSRDNGASHIADWQPDISFMPPSGDAAWEEELAGFVSANPELPEITIKEYKTAYWAKWLHKSLGELTGTIWLVGFLWFLISRKIPTGWTGRLFGIGMLIGLQGLVGWLISASGKMPVIFEMASYRLPVVHGLVFVILGLLAWYVYELRREAGDLLQARRRREKGLMGQASGISLLVFVQVILGAILTGIAVADRMALGGLPSGGFAMSPLWANFFENAVLVQFNHQLITVLMLLFALFAWWKSRRSASQALRYRYNVLLAVLLLQIALGVLTVLYAAPLYLNLLHMLVAVALLAASLRTRFEAAYPAEQKILRG